MQGSSWLIDATLPSKVKVFFSSLPLFLLIPFTLRAKEKEKKEGDKDAQEVQCKIEWEEKEKKKTRWRRGRWIVTFARSREQTTAEERKDRENDEKGKRNLCPRTLRTRSDCGRKVQHQMISETLEDRIPSVTWENSERYGGGQEDEIWVEISSKQVGSRWFSCKWHDHQPQVCRRLILVMSRSLKLGPKPANRW